MQEENQVAHVQKRCVVSTPFYRVEEGHEEAVWSHAALVRQAVPAFVPTVERFLYVFCGGRGCSLPRATDELLGPIDEESDRVDNVLGLGGNSMFVVFNALLHQCRIEEEQAAPPFLYKQSCTQKIFSKTH